MRKRGWLKWVPVALVVAWLFDPVAWLVRVRFPSATVSDFHAYRWILPGFLHSRVTPPNDCYDGTYLDVELSDRRVDLNRFRDVPFFLLVLNRCTVADLGPVDEMHLGNRGIYFKDCDLSATSAAGRFEDPKHVTFGINAP